MGDGEGWRAENGKSSAVLSVDDLDRHNSQVRLAVRSSLAPRAVLSMPLKGQTCHEIHSCGLTYRKKAVCESTAGHLVSNAWYLS